MKKIKLSNKELEIMHVFWSHKEPLAATDIPGVNPTLNINTIQAALRNLLRKSFIKVSDIIYHNTVLTRTYEPLLTQEEFLLNQMEAASVNTTNFIAALVKNEKDAESLDKLEELILAQKQKIIEKQQKNCNTK